MNGRLPRDVIATWNNYGLACPWCAELMDNAVIRLEDLFTAHCLNQLPRPPRATDGTADNSALVTHRPHCARPSMIALQSNRGERALRLLAIRTAADVAFAFAPKLGEAQT